MPWEQGSARCKKAAAVLHGCREHSKALHRILPNGKVQALCLGREPLLQETQGGAREPPTLKSSKFLRQLIYC